MLSPSRGYRPVDEFLAEPAMGFDQIMQSTTQTEIRGLIGAPACGPGTDMVELKTVTRRTAAALPIDERAPTCVPPPDRIADMPRDPARVRIGRPRLLRAPHLQPPIWVDLPQQRLEGARHHRRKIAPAATHELAGPIDLLDRQSVGGEGNARQFLVDWIDEIGGCPRRKPVRLSWNLRSVAFSEGSLGRGGRSTHLRTKRGGICFCGPWRRGRCCFERSWRGSRQLDSRGRGEGANR